MEYKPVAITLSDNQKAKLKSAFRGKSGGTIQFSLDQLKNGKDKIFLMNRQNNKLKKHKKDGTGVRIEFSCNQLKKTHKRGLLNDLLNFGEEIPVMKRIVPYARKAAPIIKEDVIPITKNLLDWVDKELAHAKGSGLDLNTLSYIKNNLKKFR